MSKALEKKSAELEQVLEKQLSSFKKGSEDWVKVGTAVAVGALIVYGLTQLSNKKKEKNTDKALEVLEREGLLNPEIKERLTQPKSSSLCAGLAQKVLFLGLALAKDKLYEQFFAEEGQAAEKKE
ncbi:MAG: hypothetical protein O2829_05990 [Bacteroidetes bacterium]|nr:hypothetical protein [Bacteroidota bacterium]MDA1268626.1 hypothetical protein [Bacteroidota bacterium]